MGQLKGPKLARRPPHLDTFTDIQAPSVKIERVNGKDKYRLTPAKPGVITIYSDNDNEKSHSSKSRAIKRELSQIPTPAAGYIYQSSQACIKQESSPDRYARQQVYGRILPVASVSGTRKTQAHEPSHRRGAHSILTPTGDSSSSSDSSGPDSSDSSESEDETDSSSDSSSSDESASGKEASASVFRPSTPASSIASSPPQTRRKREAGIRAVSSNPVAASPLRQSVRNRVSSGSGHAPLDFSIDIPARPLLSRPELASRSKLQASPTVAPTDTQTDRTARSNHHRPSNSSPVVLGFLPINHASPPENAPTEPRAMRTGYVRTACTPARGPQKPSGPVSGSSSLPFPGPPIAKERPHQKGQQRRGPARPGRIMQTVEKPPVEVVNASSRYKNGPSSRQPRAATPGPSSRRTAPPQTSPGMFVTPRAVSVWPYPVPRGEHAPQSVSRALGKRTLDESGCTDSTFKAAELERMLKRIKSHEKEMEQQRAQLEDTKRLLAEQKTRIDDLEQRRRAEELVHDRDVRTQAEGRGVAPHREATPRDVAPRRDSRDQREKRAGRRGDASRVARALLKDQERQEDLELEQQLAQEQERAVRRLQDNTRRAAAPMHIETEAEAQVRIQNEIFNRPLSGHDPEMTFDDEDRPHVSKATAFLMRLPQSFVLEKLRQLVRGRAFFDPAHPGSVHMGCWVVSRRASSDLRMKLTESRETHGFSFARLAVRLWHDEQSIYSLVQLHKHRQRAVHTCPTESCMRPDHIVVEPSHAAAERRRCKHNGRCAGHVTVHKDGTRQARKPCIFPRPGAPVRR